MTLSLDHDTTRVAESVSTDRLMEDTREIARWVRLSGSPEERRAFAYIERRLRDAGLRTQLLEHDALISLPVSAALRMIEPDADEIPCITHSFAVSTPPGGITAETIHVGESAPTAEMVRGRLAIADGLATPGRVAQLQSAGAVGVVFLNRDPLVHEMIVSTIWGSPTPLQMGQLPSVPVVSTAGEAAVPGASDGPAVAASASLREALSELLWCGAESAAVMDADGTRRGRLTLAAILARGRPG